MTWTARTVLAAISAEPGHFLEPVIESWESPEWRTRARTTCAVLATDEERYIYAWAFLSKAIDLKLDSQIITAIRDGLAEALSEGIPR